MRRERDATAGSGLRLRKVKSPRGVALTEANVLSAITVNDGKVFFSINVDAARGARLGKRARRSRERRARHSRRHRGDDRADRRAQGGQLRRRRRVAARGRRASRVRAPPAAAKSRRLADVAAGRNPGRRRRHRGRLRQGRRRQIDHRAQSGAGPARSRPQGRAARCRHLRTVGAAADRHPREAGARPTIAR